MSIFHRPRPDRSAPSDGSLRETSRFESPQIAHDSGVLYTGAPDATQPIAAASYRLPLTPGQETVDDQSWPNNLSPPANESVSATAPLWTTSNLVHDLNTPQSCAEAPFDLNPLNAGMEAVALESAGAGFDRAPQDFTSSTATPPQPQEDLALEHAIQQLAGPQLFTPQLTSPSIPADPIFYSPAMPTSDNLPHQLDASSCQASMNDAAVHPARQTHSTTTAAPGAINTTPQPSVSPQGPSTRPILQVSLYNRGDSPAGSEVGVARSLSKRSRTSRSSKHLAPEDDISSAGEDSSVEQPMLPMRRHGGVDPTQRGTAQVPSLRDMDTQRERDIKDADVTAWLESTDLGGGLGENGTFAERRQHCGRVRSKSLASPLARGDVEDSLSFDDSGIPGPGALLDEDSDYAYTDGDSLGEEDTCAQPHHDHGENREPHPSQFIRPDPWQNSLRDVNPAGVSVLPSCSMDAITKYHQRAWQCETASRMATWGSKEVGKPTERKPSVGSTLMEKATNMSRRVSCSSLRPKKPEEVKSDKTTSVSVPQGGTCPFAPIKSLPLISNISNKITKGPTLNTQSAMLAMTGHLTAVGQGASAAPEHGRGPLYVPQHQQKQRKRSKSESTARTVTGRAEMSRMDLRLSPPGAVVPSPPRTHANTDETIVSPWKPQEPSRKAVRLDLQVKTDFIIPSLEGFRRHAKELNPRIDSFLLERIVQEQRRRYQRLTEARGKHGDAVRTFCRCSSGHGCAQCETRETCSPLADPQGTNPGAAEARLVVSESEGALPEDSNLAAVDGAASASPYPSGIPLPPVKRLPAEFECPICFKMKKIKKPSDWTKHVHEDVEPFTCTFEDCDEVRSFKRKADWVRHENEKHRHLEWWQCRLPDCDHVCFRKDNFVQHLVRIHKKRDPNIKIPKTTAGMGNVASWQSRVVEGEVQELWRLVDECHAETKEPATKEICKFCHNSCADWKKLTFHLARHMEQIALPVLDLVRRQSAIPDSSPADGEVQDDRRTENLPGEAVPGEGMPQQSSLPGLLEHYAPECPNPLVTCQPGANMPQQTSCVGWGMPMDDQAPHTPTAPVAKTYPPPHHPPHGLVPTAATAGSVPPLSPFPAPTTDGMTIQPDATIEHGAYGQCQSLFPGEPFRSSSDAGLMLWNEAFAPNIPAGAVPPTMIGHPMPTEEPDDYGLNACDNQTPWYPPTS